MDTPAPKILLVDDDESLRSMYYKKLFHEGFEVTQAVNGREALEKAKVVIPDIILLDIMMPGGMNGFEVLENIKRDPRLQNIPVVMFTNLTPEEETAISMGAAAYVVKANTSLDDVVNIIRTYLPKSAPSL